MERIQIEISLTDTLVDPSTSCWGNALEHARAHAAAVALSVVGKRAAAAPASEVHGRAKAAATASLRPSQAVRARAAALDLDDGLIHKHGQ